MFSDCSVLSFFRKYVCIYVQQKLEESEQLIASLQKEVEGRKKELTAAQASLKQERETIR